MSHALRVGVADQIGYFRAYNTDGTAKVDLTSSTTGLALSVFRIGAAAVSISSLSAKAADNTAHADGAIRAVSGNLYTVDLPDAACADQVPSISVKGSYTGGVIEGPEHPLVGYNPASVAVGANTTTPPTVGAIADQVWDEARSGHVTAGTFGEKVAAELDSAARVKLDAVQPDYAPLLASGYTAPANSDITAIKAKTDNLPSDPADQSLIIVATDAVMARLGAPAGLSMSADLAAVKLETGTTLPAQIAALNNLSSAQVVSALGTGTWATALPWNAAWDSEVQSEVQDAIEVNNLDHLLKIAVDTNFATTVHLDSVIGNIADNGTTATFVRTTDSLEAIRDNQSSSSGASLEDIIAGVQSVSGGIIAAQDSSAFYITSGDTWTQDVDALGNIVGKTLVFTIKRNARDADTAALVLINSTDGLTRLAGAAASNSAWGSLTVLDDTLGNIRLTLESDATLLLKSGTYADGIKALEDGDDMTLRQRGKTIISVGVINDIS